MARRYTARKTTTRRNSDNREIEALRRELNTYLQQEITRLFNMAMVDFERNFAQSISGITLQTLNFANSGQGTATGNNGVGSAISSLLSRYTRSRTRQETRTSQAVETGRSNSENQLYRESASQQAATASQSAQSGGRNL
jgi:hypothetical protein